MLIHDRTQITSDRTKTDEGYLIVPARISRSGIQEYYAFEMGLADREPTDVVHVYRPEEEVFSKESLKSFAHKPVTNDHPPEMVTVENFKKYAVGYASSDVTRDGMFAKTTLIVSDKEAIALIESGKVELSNGYTSDIKWEAGVTPEGERYDAIQTNIRGNHIAIVAKGRCGPSCRVSDHNPTTIDGDHTMAKITIDGVDFEVSDQAAQAVGKLQTRLKDAEKEADEAEAEAKKKEDEAEEEKEAMQKDHKAALDTLQAKLDDAAAKVPTPEQLDTLVNNRMATRDAAIRLIPDFEFKGKDCETIRREVVAKMRPNVQMDTVSSDYIRAAFDLLADSAPADDMNDALRRAQFSDAAAPSGNIVTDAREKFKERNRNLGKTGGDK